jgi:hypothetical protein
MTRFRDQIRYACRVGRPPVPPPGTTHVLVFVPLYMYLDGEEDRDWELVKVANYLVGASCSGQTDTVPDGPDPRPYLGAWAARVTGCPVTLVPAEHTLKPAGLSRPRREPIFWVVPA